jgi:hypothetical protein
MNSKAKTAELAPPPRALPTTQELLAKLERTLKDEFCINQGLSEYSMIVEGLTDRAYILRAAELAKTQFGEDLLALPSHSSDCLAIIAPGKPGSPQRGGVPQMVRLAERLTPYVFTLEIYRLMFVFDHDEAGLGGQSQIEKESGFKRGKHSISLDPREHKKTCADKQVVVEDLLSLEIQKRFFDLGRASCSAEYREGRLVRYRWEHPSKGALSEYVCQNGTWADLREVARILTRTRTIFGFSTATELFGDD